MRTSFLTCACLGAVALATSACGDRSVKISRSVEDDDKPLRMVTQLECPEHQGSLTRVRTAADGLSCDYAGPRGSEVTLQLIRLNSGQTPEQGLAPLEQKLSALMPEVAAKLAKADAESAQSKAEDAEVAADKAQVAADKAREAGERAAAKADGDVDVDAPGVKVKTRNENASVRLPGLRVDTNDKGAHLSIGGLHIDADGDKSGRVNIRSNDDSVSIRTQDEAGEVRSHKSGAGIRATFILFDEHDTATGWRLVGYEARGPAGGPVVAAAIKSRSRHEDSLMESAKKLVAKNVGG